MAETATVFIMLHVKKWVCYALSLLMLLSLTAVFSACGETVDDPKDSGSGNATNADGETLPDTTENLYEDLPVENFNGYNFKVLQYLEEIGTATVLTERTGTPIEDVIYERMLVVSERLNVEFSNRLEYKDDVSSLVRNFVSSGMDEYDVVWQYSQDAVNNFLAQGYMMNLRDVEGFDFEKPWWDHSANENLALGDNLYMVFGDINIYLYDFHAALLFNKEITDNYKYDVYGMVDDGSWTLDKFTEVTTNVAVSAADGGEGNERFGYTGHFFSMYGFLHGADVNLFNYTEEGLPYMGSVNESYLNVITAYSDLFRDKTIFNTNDGGMTGTFSTQKAAFVSHGICRIKYYRDQDFSYGVIPFPKRDQAQKDYISFMTVQIQPTMIPKTAKDIERTAVVLENLSAESYRMVRPEYFEILLKSKYVKDVKSLENMQMLFECETRFELESIYNWMEFEGVVKDALAGKADQFVSSVEKYAKKVNKAIDKTLNYLNDDTQ